MFFKVTRILLFPQQTITQTTSNIQVTRSSRFSESFIQTVRQSNIDLNNVNTTLNNIELEQHQLISINNQEFDDDIIENVNNIIIESRPININTNINITSELIQEHIDSSTELIQSAQEHLNQVQPVSFLNLLSNFFGSPLITFALLGGATVGILTYLNVRNSTSSSNIITINSIPNNNTDINSNFSVLRIQTTTTRTTTVGENLDTAISNVSSNLFNNFLNGSKKLLGKFSNFFSKKD